MKQVLHVGCGPADISAMPEFFRQGWREIRFDIDPAVNPDIIGDMCNMEGIADGSFDGVYSSHNIEHLYPHQVNVALCEFRRVLNADGLAFVTVPDLQQVAKVIAEGRVEETLYTAPAGPITAMDMIYGLRAALAAGNTWMAHKTGFTEATLKQSLLDAGFAYVSMNTTEWNLWAVAHKRHPSN